MASPKLCRCVILLLVICMFQLAWTADQQNETVFGNGTSAASTTVTNATKPYEVTICPPSICQVNLFRRACFYSKQPLCPASSNLKATVCCAAGCCVPHNSALREFFTEFWLIVAIVLGVVLTSALSYWFRRSSQWFRRSSSQRTSGTGTTSSTTTNGESSSRETNPDHPPLYDVALNYPKPEFNHGFMEDNLSNPPAYDDLSLRNLAIAIQLSEMQATDNQSANLEQELPREGRLSQPESERNVEEQASLPLCSQPMEGHLSQAVSEQHVEERLSPQVSGCRTCTHSGACASRDVVGDGSREGAGTAPPKSPLLLQQSAAKAVTAASPTRRRTASAGALAVPETNNGPSDAEGNTVDETRSLLEDS